LTTKKSVKKTALTQFENIRRSGIIAIKLDKETSLPGATYRRRQRCFLDYQRGKGDQILPKNRSDRWKSYIRGGPRIKLKDNDQVIGMDVIKKERKPIL